MKQQDEAGKRGTQGEVRIHCIECSKAPYVSMHDQGFTVGRQLYIILYYMRGARDDRSSARLDVAADRTQRQFDPALRRDGIRWARCERRQLR